MTFPDRRPGGILGLDLARVCGWAYAYPGEEHAAGEWLLPPVATWGAQTAAFRQRLSALIDAFEPRSCTVEAPLSVKTDAEENYRTAFGLSAVAAATLYEGGVITRHATPRTIRATVLRDGNIAGDKVKSIVIRYCRERGWPVAGNDAADASIAREYEAAMMRVEGAACPGGQWAGHRFWRGEIL